jgi:predicted  nucleic acid-binding Zn-ribbon protein
LFKDLLRLQELDLKIEACRAREVQIPKQKEKFEIHRKRLDNELEDREKLVKGLSVEQREVQTDIEVKQTQIAKYQQQLLAVKKNEEYQALLHEIDLTKKQIGLKEERVIGLMVEMDEAKARLEEDRQRIQAELKDIEDQCAAIDAELLEAQNERERLEAERLPVIKLIEPGLLNRYNRIRQSKKTGPAVVPLRGEVCSGCHMRVTPQIVNEVMAGNKIHACHHCGRLLYQKEQEDEGAVRQNHVV